MYNLQLKLLWSLKKNNYLISFHEEETLNTITNETKKREERINKFEKILGKMSSTFKEDLGKIISKDPDVRMIPNVGIN